MVATLGHTLTDEDSPSARQEASPRDAMLFVLLEGDRPLAMSSRHSLAGAVRVRIGRGSTRQMERPLDARTNDLNLRIPDARMSSNHALLARVQGKWFVEDSGSRNGTRVNGAAVAQHELADGDLVEIGRTTLLFRTEMASGQTPDLDAEFFSEDEPLTLSPELAHDWGKLRTIAPSGEIAILIEGESGTGKEVLARRIARWSGLPGDFVGVNCGALPATLVESELFGSVKGAFSGAVAHRMGLIRSANNGVLFLDEIGDLPLVSQAALLRVLQEHEVTAVGATRPQSVNLRVISATHRDLEHAVEAGHFRHDLFARISGFRTHLPPVRERREDLGILIGQLLKQSQHDKPTLAPDAVRCLFNYPWPLNVRELSHALGTALLLAGDQPVQRQHLPKPVQEAQSTRDTSLNEQQQRHKDEIIVLLRKHAGNISAVARETGKARTQIQRWLKRYSLDPSHYQ
jgi:sigma-54 dependent transcriptional regulator, acetoin dehydrogenase operon transcriptional activator AcoR